RLEHAAERCRRPRAAELATVEDVAGLLAELLGGGLAHDCERGFQPGGGGQNGGSSPSTITGGGSGMNDTGAAPIVGSTPMRCASSNRSKPSLRTRRSM